MIWLAVADMTETLHQVTAHGGGILEPPAPDGPARTLATIIDTEGNPIGLARATARARAPAPAPAPVQAPASARASAATPRSNNRPRGFSSGRNKPG